MVLRAFNITRQTVIAARLKVKGTFLGRLIGLLGRPNLCPGEAIWISPCRALHTIGMRFPVDVIFLDCRNTVVKTAAGVSPFRVCLGGRKARSAIELAVGTLGQSCTLPGDQVEFIKDV